MGDSNPRGLAPYTLSKRAPSATRRILQAPRWYRTWSEPRAPARLVAAPHAASPRETPPGQECSKGTQALAGAWGVLASQVWAPWPRVRGVTTALYRRYRPDTFAEVVGQEHVTEPLMQALRSDRVAHAYLFSGPRGCGKTTSARILARCLNCANAPTDTPCGVCDSCVELSRGGPGSIDVVEIDAASHNGVDDARDLRERAAFAPARDKYKIFILDEAHMVTPQGFNALLKLVEEPPPHIRFVFATTEPEKVISTIRSRTHHYPFRLVPPGLLTSYLASLCDAEGVAVAPGVLPLIVRSGGGSVRDSLSVLDQLMAGSGSEGVTYERAISLLGYTDGTLLDDAIDAIAASDGASLFSVIERVIHTGHEPRRFVEDLLERLRDLLLLAAAGVDGAKALGQVPEDQMERLKDQARRLGLPRASAAADRVNDALTSMIGATSPRLHLELLAARLVAAGGAAALAGTAVPGASALVAAPAAPASSAPLAPSVAPARIAPPTAPASPHPSPPVSTETDPTPPPADGTSDTELLRRRWSEVLGTLERRRVTWVLVSQSAQVASVDRGEVRLAFSSPQLGVRFMDGNHAENVALAIRETLGLPVTVVVAESASASPSSSPAPAAREASASIARGATTAKADGGEPVTTTAGQNPDAETDAEDAAAPGDALAPDSGLTGPEVIAKMLGGTIVNGA